MALVTYDQIQQSITRYLWDRNDLSGQVPDFITLCEARLNDNLRVAQMETSASITLTSGSGTLPTDYLMWRRVLTQDSPRRRLQWAEPDWTEYEFSSVAGTSLANYFTVIGNTIKTYPTSPSNLTLYYYQKIPALASNQAGNWITNRSPGLYIYGSLLEATPFLDDDERIGMWQQMYSRALADLEASDMNARYSKTIMRIDGPTP